MANETWWTGKWVEGKKRKSDKCVRDEKKEKDGGTWRIGREGVEGKREGVG